MMRRSLTTLTLGIAALLLFPLTALAQDTGTVTGRVLDSDTEEVLPGANVLIEELGTGTATNAQGVYTLENVPEGTYTLEASFIGYQSNTADVTITAGSTTEQDISVTADLTSLDEVVVTGIASETSRANAEVATSSVNVDDLTDKATYSGVADVLAGKVAGLSVKRTSGNIGGGIRFDVRAGGGLGGAGQPVIYVDGVRVANEEYTGFGTGGQGISTLSSLNPENIENIEVLKGPAGAALYGTGGANGVVLITTKSGSTTGEPLSVRYKSVLGANTQIEEYTFENSASPDSANQFFDPGFINRQTISISGSSEIADYYGSYSYNEEKGAIAQNEQNLHSFQANFRAAPLDNLTAKVAAGFSRNKLIRPQNDNDIFGLIGNVTLAPGAFAFATRDAITDIDNVARSNDFTGSVNLNYEPVEGLELRGTAGYQLVDFRNDETILRGSDISTVTNGQRSVFELRNEQFNVDASARYYYGILGDLDATSILGVQLTDETARNFNITRENFSTSLITNVGAGADFIAGDSFFSQQRTAGIFGQQEFNYDDTYLFTLGLRRDYATAIGENAAAIYYPKASGAVRFEQFGFAPDYVDLLKVRAAYGETGTLPGRLAAIPFLYTAATSAYGAGAIISDVGNPDLEPERVREFEVGFDADLLGKLGLGFTYYLTRASDSIIQRERAPSTGIIPNVPFNIGSVDGSGVEATVDYTVFRNRENSLTLNAQYAYQTNEVTDLGGAQPIRGGFDLSITDEGFSRSAFLGYKSALADRQFSEDAPYSPSSDIVLAESSLDADGNPEREFLGQAAPAHTGSLGATFRFLDDFTFYALADFASGLSVYNGTRGFAIAFNGVKERNVAAYRLGIGLEDFNSDFFPYLDQYEFGELEPGTDAYREAAQTHATLSQSAGGVATDGNFVEDADFIKLRELSLSYDLSDFINGVAGLGDYVNRASIGFAARNILTFTGYNGIDPEVNFSGSRSQTRGYEFLTLAPPRTYTATLTLRF